MGSPSPSAPSPSPWGSSPSSSSHSSDSSSSSSSSGGKCCWGSSCNDASCHEDSYCGKDESHCTQNCGGKWCAASGGNADGPFVLRKFDTSPRLRPTPEAHPAQ